MKLLLTGATGFLGSHLLKAFLKEKYEVIILKRSFSDIWRIKKEINEVKVYDIDKCELDSIFQENSKIDAVIHTATCYGRQEESIRLVHETNTSFPLRLLELSIKYEVKRFINTDTMLPKWINEYALSKKQFLEWGEYFSKNKKIQFINMMIEHMYGPDDDENKFITYVIKRCKENSGELNLTKGEQKRDFIYIDDVVNVYLIIISKNIKNRFVKYEVGSGKKIKIRDLVQLIHCFMKSKVKLNFGAIPYRKNEVMNSRARIKKLELLGLKKPRSILEGINAMMGSDHEL